MQQSARRSLSNRKPAWLADEGCALTPFVAKLDEALSGPIGTLASRFSVGKLRHAEQTQPPRPAVSDLSQLSGGRRRAFLVPPFGSLDCLCCARGVRPHGLLQASPDAAANSAWRSVAEPCEVVAMRARFRQVPIKIMRLAHSIDRKTVELGEPSDLPAAVLLCQPNQPLRRSPSTAVWLRRRCRCWAQLPHSLPLSRFGRGCHRRRSPLTDHLDHHGRIGAFVVLAIWPLRVTPRRGIEQ